MLFSSFPFLFAFLPATLLVYFMLGRLAPLTWALRFLTLASVAFYAWWDWRYLGLIAASIVFNFLVGRSLCQAPGQRRGLLVFGIAVDLLALSYYKYTEFALENVRLVFGVPSEIPHIVLPIGISFFTFTQIAYLVDAHRGDGRDYRLAEYVLFVTFFPHLIAGPILHHKEMMPQFADLSRRRFDIDRFARGVTLFIVGLAKKVLVADTFATWANGGWDNVAQVTALEAWLSTLSYTFQLYFDFSGYSDMAIGLGWMFNIELPWNFNSPYKSRSLQDFWRRWHMTLSRFLRDYIYVPLGGNRKGEARTSLHLLTTFLLGGVWHGAGWTFLVWGAIHGLGAGAERYLKRLPLGALPAPLRSTLAWLLCFLVVHLAWVFFRAPDVSAAFTMLRALTHGDTNEPNLFVGMPVVLVDGWPAAGWQSAHGIVNAATLMACGAALLVCVTLKNSRELAEGRRLTLAWAIWLGALLAVSVTLLERDSPFLYFQF